MYHFHIITRDDSETIKKVYLKQKEASVKGDWIHLLAQDFEFIQEEQKGDEVVKLGKKRVFQTYKK